MITKLMTILKGLFTKSVLYVIAVIAFMQLYVINPLQRENTALLSRVQSDVELISFLAKRATYSIKNTVDADKLKDGSKIILIPENNMNVINLSDTTATKQTDEEKTWVGRTWEQFKNIFQ